MENNQTNSPLHNRSNKGKRFYTQMKTVFKAFNKQPKTMLMVEVETGIMRSNICRYVGKWRETKQIAIDRKGVCPISKSSGVQYLTTNPELVAAILKPFYPNENE